MKKRTDYAWLLYLLLLGFAALTSCAPIYSEKARDIRTYVKYEYQDSIYWVAPFRVHINEEWVTNPQTRGMYEGKWVAYNQLAVVNDSIVTHIRFTQNQMILYSGTKPFKIYTEL